MKGCKNNLAQLFPCRYLDSSHAKGRRHLNLMKRNGHCPYHSALELPHH